MLFGSKSVSGQITGTTKETGDLQEVTRQENEHPGGTSLAGLLHQTD